MIWLQPSIIVKGGQAALERVADTSQAMPTSSKLEGAVQVDSMHVDLLGSPYEVPRLLIHVWCRHEPLRVKYIQYPVPQRVQMFGDRNEARGNALQTVGFFDCSPGSDTDGRVEDTTSKCYETISLPRSSQRPGTLAA